MSAREPVTWPEATRAFLHAYFREHSMDDAQCAECGTVRWEHVDHFVDALQPRLAEMVHATTRHDEVILRREDAAWALEWYDDGSMETGPEIYAARRIRAALAAREAPDA